DLDCTAVYHHAKSNGISFYLLYLYKILTAINETEPFRYRIDAAGKVVVYDKIGVGPTIPRDDGTFGYGHMHYQTDLDLFIAGAKKEIEHVKKTTGLKPEGHIDIIHFSALPWIKFTSVSHARIYSFPDSVPKISVGKVTETDNKYTMPFSIHVHHGLVDGYDVGVFIKKLEELFEQFN
ncbi:MAG: chloramphenicol acetyltransferase, partial [Sphingobacteriales bacterium]